MKEQVYNAIFQSWIPPSQPILTVPPIWIPHPPRSTLKRKKLWLPSKKFLHSSIVLGKGAEDHEHRIWKLKNINIILHTKHISDLSKTKSCKDSLPMIQRKNYFKKNILTIRHFLSTLRSVMPIARYAKKIKHLFNGQQLDVYG